MKVKHGQKLEGGFDIAILLCFLLPPIGALLLWLRPRHKLVTRILLSVLAAAILFFGCRLFISLRMEKSAVVDFRPGAGTQYSPASLTPEPTQLPAPTELPYEIVPAETQAPEPAATLPPAAETQAPEGGEGFTPEEGFTPSEGDGFVPVEGTPEDGFEPVEGNAPETVQQPAITGEAVYTTANSLFYHKSADCGGKSYDVVMSLTDAEAAGLAPCSKCAQ